MNNIDRFVGLTVFVSVGMFERVSKTEIEDVPLVEFMYLVFTRMAGESYRRRLGSLLLYSVSYTHLTLPTNHRV